MNQCISHSDTFFSNYLSVRQLMNVYFVETPVSMFHTWVFFAFEFNNERNATNHATLHAFDYPHVNDLFVLSTERY